MTTMSSGIKTAVLLAALAALFMTIGAALGGRGGMIIAFVFAIATNVGSYWFSDKIVLRMYRATPVGLAHALRRIESGVRQIPMDANPATAHMFIMKPFSGRGVLGLFSSHPPTEERIKALLEPR
jgi:Zn-dependent protease with chaperone function